MENNDEFKIGSWSLLVLYIVISSILGTILIGIVTTIIRNTNLATVLLQCQDDKLLIISCLITSIVTVIVTAFFWIIIKTFVNVDKIVIEKFIKKTVIALTFIATVSVIINLYNGYNNLHKNLFTVHIAGEIVENDYHKDPDNFKGTGFAVGCKNMDEIIEAEKDATNEWIAHYFITPIIPICITLLVSIASVDIFSKIYFINNKELK